MYPKGKIQDLNRQRELQRRLRVIKHRIPELMIEFQYIENRIPSLPKPLKAPPEWALTAARWVSRNCFPTPSTEETQKDPRGTLREAIGMYDGILAFVTNPMSESDDDAPVRAAIEDVQKYASRFATTKIRNDLRTLDAKVERLLPPVTTQQLFEHNERYRRGLSSAVTAPKTAQAEIYYLLWFFWPEVQQMIPKLTSANLHKWLGTSFGLFTSLKTVELVYSELGMSALKDREKTKSS